ncbi:hypothetical protein ACOMHN_014685 [Nucella lapillus]
MQEESSLAAVDAQGTVYFKLALVFFSCQLIMINYPYDSHICPITFMDVANTINVLPLSSSYYKEFGLEGEWHMTNITSEKFTLGSSSDLNNIAARFSIHMSRKTTFYSVMVLMPLVLMSYLTVLVFLLPLDQGDKAGYLVTITISVSVFNSFFTSDMPRGLDQLPWIFRLLLMVYAEAFLILLATFFILRKYQHQKQQQDASSLPSPPPSVQSRSNRVLPEECLERNPETKGGVTELGNEGDSQRKRKRVNFGDRNITAEQLEMVAFLVAVSANTLGLAIILSNLLK